MPRSLPRPLLILAGTEYGTGSSRDWAAKGTRLLGVRAVLAAGCKVSGCTVHFCTNEYDSGPIIVQRTCPVEDGDTPDTLAARVFEQECLAYPEAIRWFAEDRLRVEGNRAKVLPLMMDDRRKRRPPSRAATSC